ncbi:hypothetical protein C8J56DRAFT_786857, partial [Mycena floridula]
AIPSVPEFSGTISSWIGVFRAITETQSMLQEGYREYYGKVFKIPTLTGWEFFISSPKLIEELRLAKDDELSFEAAIEDVF